LNRTLLLFAFVSLLAIQAVANPRPQNTVTFNQDWRFHLGEVSDGQRIDLDDSSWRKLNLPHDWSIEG